MIEREQIDLIHAQHVLTGPPSVMAARRAGIPSVCTVRDYWPLCYWSDVLADPGGRRRLSRLLRGGDDAMSAAAHGRRMAAALARHSLHAGEPAAQTVRASPTRTRSSRSVSHVAVHSRERAPISRARGSKSIPNGVDVSGVRAQADASPRPMAEPYAVFVGKLAKNKGAHALVEVADAPVSRCRWWSLATVRNAASLEQAAAAAGRDVRMLGWRDRREVFRWLRHAELLMFPSVWPEPLSRVLIEASALSRADRGDEHRRHAGHHRRRGNRSAVDLS